MLCGCGIGLAWLGVADSGRRDEWKGGGPIPPDFLVAAIPIDEAGVQAAGGKRLVLTSWEEVTAGTVHVYDASGNHVPSPTAHFDLMRGGDDEAVALSERMYQLRNIGNRGYGLRAQFEGNVVELGVRQGVVEKVYRYELVGPGVGGAAPLAVMRKTVLLQDRTLWAGMIVSFGAALAFVGAYVLLRRRQRGRLSGRRPG